jgi:hypothetical protein
MTAGEIVLRVLSIWAVSSILTAFSYGLIREFYVYYHERRANR